jgi:hypothetical protein
VLPEERYNFPLSVIHAQLAIEEAKAAASGEQPFGSRVVLNDRHEMLVLACHPDLALRLDNPSHNARGRTKRRGDISAIEAARSMPGKLSPRPVILAQRAAGSSKAG